MHEILQQLLEIRMRLQGCEVFVVFHARHVLVAFREGLSQQGQRPVRVGSNQVSTLGVLELGIAFRYGNASRQSAGRGIGIVRRVPAPNGQLRRNLTSASMVTAAKAIRFF
jgi:hypothetical protein